MPSTTSILAPNLEAFLSVVRAGLRQEVSFNKLSLEKKGRAFGITDKTEVKELTELAICLEARAIAHSPQILGQRDRFQEIVRLYRRQANLSHRTSQSIMLQQYSTPAPIGYLAGVFTRAWEGTLFEPSAGNGLLTIAGRPELTTVNEIDETRHRNLRYQGFARILRQDATTPFAGLEKGFQSVITNPPFGTLDRVVEIDGYQIKTLDHLMAIRALDCMADGGSAAIIIGGHTEWDGQGRIKAGKNRIFFHYLHTHYHVRDVINLDGHKLYSRQGTSFDVRLILIGGRKQEPGGLLPLFDPAHDRTVLSFEDLYDRVTGAMPAEERILEAFPPLPFEKNAIPILPPPHQKTKR